MAGLVRTNPSTTAFIESREAESAGKGRSFTLRWTWVPLKRISPHLQKAVIAAEDASFYRHEGFDWEGLQEALTRNWKKGTLQRGGSTITQQLAKNLYLSPEKTCSGRRTRRCSRGSFNGLFPRSGSWSST